MAGFSPDAASLYLRPGDVMEAEIEGIGVLRNPIVGRGGPRHPPAAARALVSWPRDDAKLDRVRALWPSADSTRSSSARPTTSST